MTKSSGAKHPSGAEGELGARVAWLRATIELLTDHAVVLHDAEGRPVLANETAARVLSRPIALGVELEEHARALGLKTPEGQLAAIPDHPVTIALRGVRTRDRTFSLVRADGKRVSVLVDASPVRGGDDRIEGALFVMRDLAEIERAQAFREAFLSRASHELRTPLAALLTATQVLERRARKRGEPPDRALEIVVESVQNLRKLVEDILDLSRIGRGRLELRREQVPLLPILRAGAEDACRARGVPSSTVAIASGEDVASHWDPDRLRQTVRNLVDNALVHGKPPVRVQIDERGDERVTFSVRDGGDGIPEDRRAEVVQPFVRRDRDVGPGLGLAIASEVARAHGGRLRIESGDDGKGCAVLVELPFSRA